MPTPTMEDVLKLVRLQLGRRLVRPGDRFVEDLGAESADIANLAAAVEERYGITVSESDLARLATPQDLYDLVQRLAR